MSKQPVYLEGYCYDVMFTLAQKRMLEYWYFKKINGHEFVFGSRNENEVLYRGITDRNAFDDSINNSIMVLFDCGYIEETKNKDSECKYVLASKGLELFDPFMLLYLLD